jgi:pimeloyl-ACP methyl ester carboxylesterase
VSKNTDYRAVRYLSDDGLRLFARDYNSADTSLVPVLCLPGLTRNSKDFETIAPFLAQNRRVISVDFRGRGLSQYASNPLSYRPEVELADTIALLKQLEIERSAVIGTSRGGIVGLLMAALHPEKIVGLMLNDIGPVLETAGLLRIRSYLGVDVRYPNWEQAIDGLKQSNVGFHSLFPDEWRAFASRVFKTAKGKPRIDYDPALARNFPSHEDIAEGRIPKLWELFAATNAMPVSVLRGEHSDLLSVPTVEDMRQQNLHLDATTVMNRGHAPFLDEPESLDAMARWLTRIDANKNGQ